MVGFVVELLRFGVRFAAALREVEKSCCCCEGRNCTRRRIRAGIACVAVQ